MTDKKAIWKNVLIKLAFMGLGFVIAALVLVDPWNLHPWFKGNSEETAKKTGERKILFYRNPMNPDQTSPIPMKDEMGMEYIPVYEEETEKKAEKGKVLFYRNPMDPTITSPVPRKDEMGMDYIPVYEGEGDITDAATVTIDPSIVQNIGVVTTRVSLQDVRQKIRTVGYLDYDQEKMVAVTTKYNGFVEKVYVNYLGQPVKKGGPLFEIYSPQLVQTEQELLSALQFAQRMENSPPEAKSRAEALVEAARQRLSYWDITPQQIQKLEDTGTVFRTLTVTSPASGLVMKRMPGLEGMAVMPGMDVFHIAGLSTLWLQVEVFENQLAWIDEGSKADITFPYFPGQSFTGKVRFVEPEVSEKTRTVKVTLELPNPDGKLRAGMYAQVEFGPVLARETIAVPNTAVLRTGERNVVIVSMGEGRFQPREVNLGAEGENYVQVLSGLQAGEQIVTSAQFLIDSESNLREAIQKMISAKKKG